MGSTPYFVFILPFRGLQEGVSLKLAASQVDYCIFDLFFTVHSLCDFFFNFAFDSWLLTTGVNNKEFSWIYAFVNIMIIDFILMYPFVFSRIRIERKYAVQHNHIAHCCMFRLAWTIIRHFDGSREPKHVAMCDMTKSCVGRHIFVYDWWLSK